MTEVYVFHRGEELPEAAAALLPRWRYERWARLRYAPAKQESLAAGLLYTWAMKRQGVPPGEDVTFLPAGKPVLAGQDGVFFSLSHSGRYALCAVSTFPVGADVQLIRAVRPTMARRFHPAEQAWLEGQEDWIGSFFRLWARKEAWVKAASDERVLSLEETDVIHPPPGLWFRDLELSGGYTAAVCSGEESILAPVEVTREELLAAPGWETKDN